MSLNKSLWPRYRRGISRNSYRPQGRMVLRIRTTRQTTTQIPRSSVISTQGEANVADNNEAPAPARQRQRKTPQRRSYAAELAAAQEDHVDLRSRVAMALRLLKKTNDSEAGSPAARELIAVAIETLEGK